MYQENDYLVPNLNLPLYLDVDFFESFNIYFTIEALGLNDIPPSVLTNGNELSKQHSLTEDQIQQLNSVIRELPNCNELIFHSIDVGDAAPVKQRHYAVSPAVEKELYAELDRMISLGVIEESRSIWCSPMAHVRKSNGKIRLCLDARKINSVTKKDAYPLPLIDGLLSRLDQTRFLSCLDLKRQMYQE